MKSKIERDTIQNRLKLIMELKKMKQADVLAACEPYCKKYGITLSKGLLSHYLTGKNEPSRDRIFILAKGLNVSEAWLLGYDVSMEKTESDLNNKNTVKRLMAYLNKLGEEKLIEYLKDLTENPKYLK